MQSLRELERAVALLAPALVGHRVQGVSQPDGESVVLSIHGAAEHAAERHHHLLLCASPEAARLSLLARTPHALPSPPAFTQYLRAHVVGARIASLATLGGDRVAALELETWEGARRLVLQIFGRRSNVWLLGADARVEAALRPPAATRPELAVGSAWELPPGAPPRSGEDRFAGVADAALFEAVEAAYAERAAEGEKSGLRRRIDQALRREERRLERKLEKLEQELEAARAATRLAREGELLKGALGSVARGDREARVTDPETGAPVVIALDPALSPAENLDALFRRYRKAVRSLTKGGAQEQAVRAAHAGVAALRGRFEAAGDDGTALAELARHPELAPLVERHAPVEPRVGAGARGAAPEVRIGKQLVPRRMLPRRYPTAGGLEIWVGRSDAANDFLTTRIARGKDLFFHVEGAPGSHVILRTEGREDPPSEALLDACELAVHFSKHKNATRADVHIVPIKNVRKPKGAKPGLVMVHGGRRLHLRRTPARLERLLAARVPEP